MHGSMGVGSFVDGAKYQRQRGIYNILGSCGIYLTDCKYPAIVGRVSF
jgi:hypothetical protein